MIVGGNETSFPGEPEMAEGGIERGFKTGMTELKNPTLNMFK